MTTVWDAANKSPNISLFRNGVLAASGVTSGSWKAVRATTAIATGKKVFEVYCPGYFNDNGWMVGLANASLNLAAFPGSDGNGIGYQASNGSVYKNGSSFATIQSNGALWGTVIQFAVDLDAKLIWFRTGQSPNWNNSAGNNPATGVGGLSYAATGAMFPAWAGYDGSNGNMASLNAGGFPFVLSIPSGFGAWDAGPVTTLGITGTPPSAFDPANKDSHITLSNSNKTATNITAINNSYAVKANTAFGGGRRYFEIKADDWAVGSGLNGLFLGWAATGRTNLGNPGQDMISSGLQVGDAAGFTGAYINGQRFMAASTWNSAENDTIGVAIDVDKGLWWAKNVTQNTNWNGVASASPATGIGGWAVQVAADYPYFQWSANANSGSSASTVNFGAAAFAGAIPSGFTGWDAPVVVAGAGSLQTAVSVL